MRCASDVLHSRRLARCAVALLLAATLTANAADTRDGCTQRVCDDDAIFQVVPLQGLIAGVLESPFTFADVLARGDFGMGGMSPLDGEAIIVDGRAWHARLDGSLREVQPDEGTAVLFAKRFRADRNVRIASVDDLDALVRMLDASIADPNRFHAVRIDARFDRLRLRSVPRQTPPYVSVNEVVQTQQVLELENVEGTLVGFRFPAYVGGVNAPGYHFHFVDAARRQGGHLLDVAVRDADAQIDASRMLTLVVPDDPLFDGTDLTGGDGFDRALRPGAKPDPER